MLAADADYESACYALGRSWRKSPEFAAIMRRLQSDGRDDAFWRAIHDAVETLRRDGIDYVARARWIEDDTTLLRAAGLAGIPEDEPTLDVWFRCQWAKLRPQRSDALHAYATGERLRRFDELFGRNLDLAATRLLEESADERLVG